MTEVTNKKRYDLDDRTFAFAKACRDFVKSVPMRLANIEYGRQLIRSSASQAANYIEANEALSKKDFSYRIRICRKEAKESCLWLKLLEVEASYRFMQERDKLIAEAVELRKIFSAILNRSK